MVHMWVHKNGRSEANSLTIPAKYIKVACLVIKNKNIKMVIHKHVNNTNKMISCKNKLEKYTYKLILSSDSINHKYIGKNKKNTV